jgi:hypothetical protein
MNLSELEMNYFTFEIQKKDAYQSRQIREWASSFHLRLDTKSEPNKVLYRSNPSLTSFKQIKYKKIVKEENQVLDEIFKIMKEIDKDGYQFINNLQHRRYKPMEPFGFKNVVIMPFT